MTMKRLFTLVSAGLLSAGVHANLMITAVYDGPLPGGLPKGVELYVTADIADLSIYGLGGANNGGGSDGQEFTFPAESAAMGDTIYVATESTQFSAFFGFAPTYTSASAMSANSEDEIFLLERFSGRLFVVDRGSGLLLRTLKAVRQGEICVPD